MNYAVFIDSNKLGTWNGDTFEFKSLDPELTDGQFSTKPLLVKFLCRAFDVSKDSISIEPIETICKPMNAEDKLKEMTDRGWHVKVSRQKDSTWDLVGAIDGLAFRDGQTYCTYGIHTSLLAALLDLEQMLLKDSAL